MKKKPAHTIGDPISISGRDEMNLAEFPFATLNSRDQRAVISYEGWITVDEHRLPQKWIVRSASGLGLLSEFGERLLIALIAITAEENFSSPKITFSVNDLIKRLGIAKNRDRYRRIEEQLDRLVGITIHSENAFWDHARQKRVTTKTAFHVLEKLWLRYREAGGEAEGEEDHARGYIIWSDSIWRSFKAGYIKTLDLELLYRLPTPLSRRLYRFLDKRMRYQNEYEIDIFELTNRLGCVRYEAPSQVERLIMPACETLIEYGFLQSAEIVKRGKYRRFHFTKASNNETPQLEDRQPQDDEQPVGRDEVDETEQAWQTVLELLRLQMTKSTFDAWLKGTHVTRQNDRTLVIGVKSHHAQEWLENRLKVVIEKTVKDTWAYEIEEVEFEVEGGSTTAYP